MRLSTIQGSAIVVFAGAAVVIIVVALVVFAAVPNRRKRATRRDLFTGLGFMPVASPSPDLLDRLAALQPTGRRERLHVRELYRRTISGGDAYLFDLTDDDSESQTWTSGSAIAVVAPSLALPYMALMPKLSLDAHFGSLLGGAFQKAMALATAQAGLTRVAYPDDVEFDERFTVFAKSEPEVRGFLINRRRTALLELPEALFISANGDAFALSLTSPAISGQTAAASIQTLLDLAERLLSLLSG